MYTENEKVNDKKVKHAHQQLPHPENTASLHSQTAAEKRACIHPMIYFKQDTTNSK